MAEVFTVAFFGHRYITELTKAEERLEEQIVRLVLEHKYVYFLVGRNGEFDQCAASVVLRVKKKFFYENCFLLLVLPYDTAEYRNNRESFESYYDGIELAEKAAKAHPKAAIQQRNKEMTDRADLVLCWIEHKAGGAWKAVQYAIKCGKKVANLAEQPCM